MARIRVWLFSLLTSQDLIAGTMLNVILEKLIGASDTVGNGGQVMGAETPGSGMYRS